MNEGGLNAACCSLCLEKKKLEDSHIISKFIYKPLYKSMQGHKFYVLSTSPEEKTTDEQEEVREKLLCRQCEERLSLFEDHVARVFRRRIHDVKPKPWRGKNRIVVKNINYQRFKLFELSLLWRASVSKHRFFSQVKLDSDDEEKLRQMILAKDSGEPYDYGCVLIMPLWEKNKIIDDLIFQPDYLLEGGQKYCRFSLLGCLWVFVVATGAENSGFEELFLRKDGTLIVIREAVENIDLFRTFAKNLKSAGKLESGK